MNYEGMLQFLTKILYFLSVTIIVYGIVVQYIGFLVSEFKSKSRKSAADNIMTLRNFLGTYILFSLEVLIGADILESIIAPTMEHIINLAALVIIRTIISYFLNKEIESNKTE